MGDLLDTTNVYVGCASLVAELMEQAASHAGSKALVDAFAFTAEMHKSTEADRLALREALKEGNGADLPPQHPHKFSTP